MGVMNVSLRPNFESKHPPGRLSAAGREETKTATTSASADGSFDRLRTSSCEQLGPNQLLSSFVQPMLRRLTTWSSAVDVAAIIRRDAKAGDLVMHLGAGHSTEWAHELPGELGDLAVMNAELASAIQPEPRPGDKQ
jgi:hypothetical protein